MFCTTKDEVKATIRKFQMAHGDRQIGKTQAILEVVHEDYQGNAVLVLPTFQLVDLVKRRYQNSGIIPLTPV